MEGKDDLAKHGFEMSLPQRGLMYKVICDSMEDILHTSFAREELSSTLVKSKYTLFKSSRAQIVA